MGGRQSGRDLDGFSGSSDSLFVGDLYGGRVGVACVEPTILVHVDVRRREQAKTIVLDADRQSGISGC